MVHSPVHPPAPLQFPSQVSAATSTFTSPTGSRGSPSVAVDSLASATDEPVVYCDEGRFNELLAIWRSGNRSVEHMGLFGQKGDLPSPPGSGSSSDPQRHSPLDQPNVEVEAAVAGLRQLTIRNPDGAPNDIVLPADSETPIDEFMERLNNYNEREPGLRLFVSLLEEVEDKSRAYNNDLRRAVAAHNAAHPEASAVLLDAGVNPPARESGRRAIPVVPVSTPTAPTPAVLVHAKRSYYSAPRHNDTFVRERRKADRKGVGQEFREKYQPPAPLPPVSCWKHFENFLKAIASFFEDLWKRIVSCFTCKT